MEMFDWGGAGLPVGSEEVDGDSLTNQDIKNIERDLNAEFLSAAGDNPGEATASVSGGPVDTKRSHTEGATAVGDHKGVGFEEKMEAMQQAILELTAEMAYLRGRPTTSRPSLSAYETPTVEENNRVRIGLPRRSDQAAWSQDMLAQPPPIVQVHGMRSNQCAEEDRENSIASEEARQALGALGAGIEEPTTEDRKRKAEEDSRARARAGRSRSTPTRTTSYYIGARWGARVWDDGRVCILSSRWISTKGR